MALIDSRTINKQYKEEFRKLTASLGRTPTTKDPEYWELTGWYNDQYDEERIKRVIEDRRERAQEKKYEGPVKVVEKVCATCDNIIPLNKRGKPPKYCEDCRGKVKKKDNLCRECKSVIPPTGKRGRPAVLCSDCKSKK